MARRSPAGALLLVLVLVAACAAAAAGCGGAERKPQTRGPSEATFTATVTTPGSSEPEVRCRPAPDQRALPSSRRDVRVAGLDGKAKTRPRTLDVAREITLTCLVWASFGGSTGLASGVAEVLDCVPTCAQSSVTRRMVRISVTDLRPCRGRRYYSSVRLVVGADESAERPRGFLTVPCTEAAAP